MEEMIEENTTNQEKEIRIKSEETRLALTKATIPFIFTTSER